MYFNCFRPSAAQAAKAGAPVARDVSDWPPDAAVARYALSATREGASPHSCSRR